MVILGGDEELLRGLVGKGLGPVGGVPSEKTMGPCFGFLCGNVIFSIAAAVMSLPFWPPLEAEPC